MGIETVKLAESPEEVKSFMKAVLKDIRALEKMLDEERFETDTIRIGAEQEICLIDNQAKAAPWAMEVLKELEGKGNFTTEFAKFNLEVNMDPLEFKGDCLRDMENNILTDLSKVRDIVERMGGDIILTGILPSIRKSDVDPKNITPMDRYYALCDGLRKLKNNQFNLKIEGMDELLMEFDSPFIEACNTAFQTHLQVTPRDFVQKYNIAQAITGPVLACAVGSPFLFGKRLWSETRIALFQQSVDIRKASEHLRHHSARVSFGTDWVDQSILEIFQEDTARHRIMFSTDLIEDLEQKLRDGIAPDLNALTVHNSTVYKWNRPCYGVSKGFAHLRIENRVLPAGPTVGDQMANMAFWLGLMNKMGDYYPDVREVMDFDAARHNFVAASKMGLDTSFLWLNGKRVNAIDLIKNELIPIAREGLEKAAINPKDIDHYLGIIHDRVDTGQTASYWMVKNFGKLRNEGNSQEQSLAAITTAMVKNQRKGEPIHKWGRVRMEDLTHWQASSLLVEEFMTTDLFTVQKDDLLEFCAQLMEWRKIRYVLVEDDDHHLIGLVTMRDLFKKYGKVINSDDQLPEIVEEFMITNPITIHPDASIVEAVELMTSQKIGCLPVIENNKLVGIITEQNYLSIANRLIRDRKSDQKTEENNNRNEVLKNVSK